MLPRFFILYFINVIGFPETWYHARVCFMGEIINPFLNVREFLRPHPRLKQLNKYFILVTYTLFRVIGLPFTFYEFLINVPLSVTIFYGLLTGAIIITTMSFVWYSKILKMCLPATIRRGTTDQTPTKVATNFKVERAHSKAD